MLNSFRRRYAFFLFSSSRTLHSRLFFRCHCSGRSGHFVRSWKDLCLPFRRKPSRSAETHVEDLSISETERSSASPRLYLAPTKSISSSPSYRKFRDGPTSMRSSQHEEVSSIFSFARSSSAKKALLLPPDTPKSSSDPVRKEVSDLSHSINFDGSVDFIELKCECVKFNRSTTTRDKREMNSITIGVTRIRELSFHYLDSLERSGYLSCRFLIQISSSLVNLLGTASESVTTDKTKQMPTQQLRVCRFLFPRRFHQY